MKTTNYYNTLIQIADDSPTFDAQIPPEKKAKSIANYQYEMLAKHPYQYTSDEVIFGIYAERRDLSKSQLKKEQELFFSKGQPCLRTSPLAKKYGWGIHSNVDGKVALVASNSERYQQLQQDENVSKTKAMRSKRAD